MAFYNLPENRYHEIREFAGFLWDEYSDSDQLDPFRLLEEQEITHTFSDYEDAFDGLLEYKDARFHVYLNKNRLRSIVNPRCRFTVSHELGHFFLDEHRNGLISGRIKSHGSFTGFQSTNVVIEVEADHFASHLLMPADIFSQRASKIASGMEAIQSLAKSFGTSRSACAVRFVKQEVQPSAVFKWKKNGSLQWKLLSGEFYKRGFRRSVESRTSLPPDSPTSQILSPAVPSGIVKSGTTANTWFPGVGMRGNRNEILIEECISLGPYGALTLLTYQS